MTDAAADRWPVARGSYLPAATGTANGDDGDSAPLRAIFGCFATGVTVVTANAGGRPVGMTINSFASASLRPPLVLFCAGEDSQTWPQIRRAGCFAVNILASDQCDVARRFANRDGPRFTGKISAAAVTRSPVLPGALAYIDCVLCETHQAGDHAIVVAHVVEAAKLRGDPPLVFFASTWHAQWAPSGRPA
jgi:3-hydroxy-9,10-secoandrosta-1,3,5(10)-triene-9,17-dione monooxygenase reductase component